MTLLTNSFEGITPSGTTVSTGNSGGVSGNAFDTVNIGASATVASDSTHAAHGTLAATVSTGASSVSAYVGWNTTMGTQAQAWFRGYYFFTANPAANFSIWRAFSSGTLAAGILLLTTGQLRFVNTSSATILTTTATVPLNAWWRIEGFVIGSATVGQVELKLFTSPDAAAPAETDTSAASQNTFGSLTEWRWGVSGNTANVTQFWEDDLGLSNTGYIGPAAFAAVPAVAAQPGQTWQRQFHHRQNSFPSNQYFVNVLAGSVTTAGAVTDRAEPVYTGSVTTTGAVADRVGKAFSATAGTAAASASQVAKTLPAAVATAGALGRALSRLLAVTAATAGALGRALTRLLTGTTTTTGSATRALARLLPGDVNTAGSNASQPRNTLPAAVSTTGMLGPRGVARNLTATVTTTASAATGFLYSRVFPVTVATAGALRRAAAKVLSAATSTAASLLAVIRPPSTVHPVITITPAAPLAAVVTPGGALTAAVTVTTTLFDGIPGAGDPGAFIPGAPYLTLPVLTAVPPPAEVAITPAGPAAAVVLISQV